MNERLIYGIYYTQYSVYSILLCILYRPIESTCRVYVLLPLQIGPCLCLDCKLVLEIIVQIITNTNVVANNQPIYINKGRYFGSNNNHTSFSHKNKDNIGLSPHNLGLAFHTAYSGILVVVVVVLKMSERRSKSCITLCRWLIN